MTRVKRVSAVAEETPGDGAGQDLDPRLLSSLCPQNLLSFGPGTAPLLLTSLNVLVGPNGSGKSNFLEVLALLRSSATDLRSVLSTGGGVLEWIWKGKPSAPASVVAVARNPRWAQPLRHVIALRAEKQAFRLLDERIENEKPDEGKDEPYFYYRFQQGHPVINLVTGGPRQLTREVIDPDLPILAQRRDPDSYPEITYLAETYPKIRLYREWAFGRNTVFRVPQRADMRNAQLEEDFSNLGLVLNRLRRTPRTKAALLSHLKDLYEGLTDYDVSVEGGTVQVFFTEGDFTIPATRLSDGSLRYLCLLAILCDPEPPPLIGIEEPELGLHPDLIPKIADLLVEASQRTQLIVTTHSDILIDALSERPECVVVCEKHEGQTTMRRLDRVELAEWLKTYRLGQLWTRGQIGGTRW
jgi:predicted ATPase